LKLSLTTVELVSHNQHKSPPCINEKRGGTVNN